MCHLKKVRVLLEVSIVDSLRWANKSSFKTSFCNATFLPVKTPPLNSKILKGFNESL